MWPTEYSRDDNKGCPRQGHRRIPACSPDLCTLEKSGIMLCGFQRHPKEQRRRWEGHRKGRISKGQGKKQNVHKATEMWPKSGQECPLWPSSSRWLYSSLRHEDSLNWRTGNSRFLPTAKFWPTTSHLLPPSLPPHYIPPLSFLSENSLVFLCSFRNTVPKLLRSIFGKRPLMTIGTRKLSLNDRELVQVTGVSKTRLKWNYRWNYGSR